MKRKYLALALSFCLSGSLLAQPKMQFDKVSQDLGKLIWHNPGKADFKFKNTGNEPLILKAIEPDCGCTTVNWSSAPVAPGGSGIISVSYDAEQLGHFHKGFAIYTNINDVPIYTSVMGHVILEQERTNNVDLKYKMGDLSLSTDNIEFDDVMRGDTPVRSIEIYNGSDKTITPGLMHLPPYLSATIAPKRIHPKRMGKITMQLNSQLIKDMGLTQTSIYLSQYQGERISPKNELAVSVTILPDKLELSDRQQLRPVAVLDSAQVQLGVINGKRKNRTTLYLTNQGKLPLKIDALQVYNPGLSVSINTRTILPGQKAKMKISVSNATNLFRGRRRILLITNDPIHPKMVIDVEIKK